MKKKKITLNARLPEELHKKMDNYFLKTRISKNQMIVDALEIYFQIAKELDQKEETKKTA